MRILGAVARIWDKHPPFKDMEAEEIAKQPWYDEWKQMTQENLDLLIWSAQQCQENISFDCMLPQGEK